MVTALDVLSGNKKTGQDVVVAGGGAVGCEVANFLAQQKKKVTVVEMSDTVRLDMDSWIWKSLSAELAEGKVNILTSMQLDKITDEGILLIDNNWNKISLKAETVVLASGLKGNDTLAKECAGKVKEVFILGDAKQPRRIKETISESYLTAYNL